jgi:spermidine synthase
MGVLPFVLHPHAEDILVIGYGLGVTSSILATLSPKPVDCVEICPGVIKASRQFSRWNDSVFANPRLRLMPGDGRNYLLCTRKQYDVISCDPTHPSLGSGALYTQEFYRLCRRRLRPGGVFTLYMPLHQIREPDFRRLLGTFAREFPRCGLWLGIAHAVLVGVDRGPLVLDYQRATGVFAALPSGTGDALRAVFLDDARRLCGSMLLDSAGMYAIGSGAGVAADDRPGFEYAGARAGGTATWTRNAEVVLSALTGPGRALAGAGAAQDSVIAAASATAARLCATVAAMRGDREQQVAWFRQALQFDPEDREAARFLAASLPPDR